MDYHSFSSGFRLRGVELPPGGPDYELGKEYGSYMETYLVEPGDAPGSGLAPYTLGIHSPTPGIRALSGAFPTPNRWTACVVARGIPFLGDARDPHSFTEVREARRDVVDARALQDPPLLLLITELSIVAISSVGVAWSTQRLALDGFDVSTTPRDGWLVCRPRSEPGGVLLVNLQDGQVTPPV